MFVWQYILFNFANNQFKQRTMEEKLKELRRKKEEIETSLAVVNREIEEIKRKRLESNKKSYKGKWFYQKDSWWDEFESECEHYKIVYVKDVHNNFGCVNLTVVIFEFDYYWELRDLNVEIDEYFSVLEIQAMKEMSDIEFCHMDRTFRQLLDCISEIRPSLKNNITT